MKVLFCRISWMNFYKGIIPGVDQPINGGAFPAQIGQAEEEYNFFPFAINPAFQFNPALFFSETMDDRVRIGPNIHTDANACYCLGFSETKSHKDANGNDVPNTLHIERISGCAGCVNDPFVDDVLVIYCATPPNCQGLHVVGWYNHATVFRSYRKADLTFGNGNTCNGKLFNAMALAKDCVLLPPTDRTASDWSVPQARRDGVGFGQSNVWYADRGNPARINNALNRITSNIISYTGQNFLTVFPPPAPATGWIARLY